MNNTVDILELLNRCPNATICIQASDLGHFARQLLAEARKDYERHRREMDDKENVLLDAEAVKTALGISQATLYRFAKSKILEPVWIGGQRRYRQGDINKLKLGRRM